MTSSEVEIGVWVDGTQKWVTGVSRRTTCHDVIKALLRAQNLPAQDSDINNYVIVERWRKVERPLDHEQRILKVWKTWGEAIQEVRFTLRRVREDGERLESEAESRTERSRRRHRRKSTQGPNHVKDSDKTSSKKTSKDDPNFGETMDRLMRLVLAQGETIQTQLRRLQERDHQIENYEQQMHLLRIKSVGSDYLLHSYLKDPSKDPHATSLGQSNVSPKDDLTCEETSNDSGVVTEEICDPLPPQEKKVDVTSKLEVAEEVEEVRLRVSALESLESILTNLIEQELYLSNLENSFIDLQNSEVAQIKEELALVSKMHSQTVSDVRQNEAQLRELDAILFHRKSSLDSLFDEELKLDEDIMVLEGHLEFIMHLPPSAFTFNLDESPPLIKEEPNSVVKNDSNVSRGPAVPSSKPGGVSENKKECLKDSTAPLPSVKTPQVQLSPLVKKDSPDNRLDHPPPLPSSSPPPLEIGGDTQIVLKSSLHKTGSQSSSSSSSDLNPSGSSDLSSSSCSTTVSESSTEILKNRTCSKKCIDPTKDSDSADSNSDTGLSSLHSSSDDGVIYSLDTLV